MAYRIVTISSPGGETRADFVPEANMVCCSLLHRGAELLDPTHGLEAYAERGKTMGIPLLHPWANRLAEPTYTVQGRTVELPGPEGNYPTDPNGLPIHGALPAHQRWGVVDQGDDRVTARLPWHDAPALLALFPFAHELELAAVVAAGRLTLTTTIRATGSDAVPVAIGFHPYLTIPGTPRAQWRVALGASDRLLLDDHMIPTGAREPLAERMFTLGDQSWDDGLDGLDADGARFSVCGGETTVTVAFEDGFDYAQVYAPPAHDYICFEPMTAPTNALRSGEGLTVVAPGKAYVTRWSVSVTP
jgi:galactose mutarotase-like enzyme